MDNTNNTNLYKPVTNAWLQRSAYIVAIDMQKLVSFKSYTKNMEDCNTYKMWLQYAGLWETWAIHTSGILNKYRV